MFRKKSYLEEKLVELFGEVAIPFAFFLLPFLAKAEIILIKVVTLVCHIIFFFCMILKKLEINILFFLTFNIGTLIMIFLLIFLLKKRLLFNFSQQNFSVENSSNSEHNVSKSKTALEEEGTKIYATKIVLWSFVLG